MGKNSIVALGTGAGLSRIMEKIESSAQNSNVVPLDRRVDNSVNSACSANLSLFYRSIFRHRNRAT